VEDAKASLKIVSDRRCMPEVKWVQIPDLCENGHKVAFYLTWVGRKERYELRSVSGRDAVAKASLIGS
jgi:hypothetical protein